MLTKNNIIEVPKENPFANDKLERKNIAENLTRLIQTINQPFVISAEAPWGWGKTTFVRMWKAHLETLGHTCLYFNAWENDFVEDPLIAFVGEIGKVLVDKRSKGNTQKQLLKLQNIGGKIARRSIPLAIQIATQGVLSQDTVKKASDLLFLNSNEIANFTSELAEEKIKQYENDKNGILEFKKELSNFAKVISEKDESKKPVVFFIDELDRCRPDFAISLIERVKHIFSVEGIVFVLVMDRTQLEQSVKTLFGTEMKEDGYLRRFIDFRFQLPKPSIENLCKSLHSQFRLNELFSTRKNENEELFIKAFLSFAITYNFSLRVIEQCYTEMNFLLRTTPPNRSMNSVIVAFWVAFKSVNPVLFLSLPEKIDYQQVKDVMQELRSRIGVSDRFVKWLFFEIEAYLIFCCMSERENESIYAELRRIAEDESTPEGDEKKHARGLMGSLEGYAYTPNRYAITQLLPRYNMLEQLLPSNV